MGASRLRERGPLGPGDGPSGKNQTGGGHGTEGPWWRRRREVKEEEPGPGRGITSWKRRRMMAVALWKDIRE